MDVLDHRRLPNTDVTSSPVSLAELPPDVLSLVFLSLHQSFDENICCNPPFQIEFSHVCKYWREIALSSPRLWSKITFFVYSTRSESCVREWLIRSRGVPLHVQIILTGAPAGNKGLDPTITPQGATLELLASHIHRFRSLVFSAAFGGSLYYLFRLFEHAEAPLLEELRIRCTHDGPQRLSLNTVFIGGLPNLAFIELPSLRCLPPLTSVTDFRFTNIPGSPSPTLSQLSDAIVIPHRLISLSIEGCVSRHDDILGPGHGLTVNLPELRRLELYHWDGTICIYFLGIIRAPNLEYLRLSTGGDRWYIHDFLDARRNHPIQRVTSLSAPFDFPSLKYLTLDSQPLSTDYLTAYIRAFPSLTHLLFINPQFGNHFLTNGCWKESFHAQTSGASDIAWPNLKVISFEWVANAIWAISEFIEACPTSWKVVGDSKLLSLLAPKNPRIELYEPEKHGAIDPWRCSGCYERRRHCIRRHDCHSMSFR